MKNNDRKMNKKQQETGCFLHVEERKRLIDMDKMPKWLLVLILVVFGLAITYLIYLDGNWVAQRWW